MSMDKRARIEEIKIRVLGAAVLGVLIASAGCGSSSSNSGNSNTGGAVEPVANGAGANAYVVSDQTGTPHAIGVSVQAAAFGNPPQLQNMYPNALAITLPLPASTPSTIPFRSVTLFTTAGHGPAVNPVDPSVTGPYETPHLHIAFSFYTAAERGGPGAGSVLTAPNFNFLPGTSGIGSKLWGLTPTQFNTPATFESFFDSGYDLQPNPYYVPITGSLPSDVAPGVHFVDYSSIAPQELPTLGTVFFNPFVSEFNINPSTKLPGAFTTEVDYAFYQGNFSSFNLTSNLNELVTLDSTGNVATREPINLTLPLDLPVGYATSGYYPTTYTIRYDGASDSFRFELGNMVFRQATDTSGNPLPQSKAHVL